MFFRDDYEVGTKSGKYKIDSKWDLFFFFEIPMILGEKSKRRDQSPLSFLENINFWKSLPRAPEFEYPPLFIPFYFLTFFVGLHFIISADLIILPNYADYDIEINYLP